MKNDKMFLADYTEDEGPKDSFKSDQIIISPKQELPTDVTKVKKLCKPGNPNYISNQRWAEKENKFKVSGNKRLSESYKPVRPSDSDFAPLYSSLAKDKIYVPPVTAKDMLDKK